MRGTIQPKHSDAEAGYSLPSILFLVTILSLVALSVLTLNYFRRQGALLEVARVKADYAAQSGIARFIGASKLQNQATDYVFDDESEAMVVPRYWGLFTYVSSRGQYRKTRSDRIALLAELPSKSFDNALIFASSDHQLVFAGDSRVVGDVVVGLSGVTTGTLRDVRTPRSIPITGRIQKESSVEIPFLDEGRIHEVCTRFDAELGSGSSVGQRGAKVIDLTQVADTVGRLHISGNVRIIGQASRRLIPLSVSINGDVVIDSSAHIKGLIAISSSDGIFVQAGCEIEHGVLYSKESIELQSGASVTAQLLAPYVVLENGSTARYPSVILNFSKVNMQGEKLETILRPNSRIEGTIIQMRDEDAMRSGSGIIIEKGSMVVGSVYSENRLTLDGDVQGTVIAKDFYFYEAPTQYYGWIRTGSIDHTALPEGYLIPGVFHGRQTLRVLDWL